MFENKHPLRKRFVLIVEPSLSELRADSSSSSASNSSSSTSNGSFSSELQEEENVFEFEWKMFSYAAWATKLRFSSSIISSKASFSSEESLSPCSSFVETTTVGATEDEQEIDFFRFVRVGFSSGEFRFFIVENETSRDRSMTRVRIKWSRRALTREKNSRSDKIFVSGKLFRPEKFRLERISSISVIVGTRLFTDVFVVSRRRGRSFFVATTWCEGKI